MRFLVGQNRNPMRLGSRALVRIFRFGISVCVLPALLSLGFAAPALAKCRMKNPDTEINGMTLTDSESIVRVIGADSDANLIDDDHDLPHVRFVTSNGAQEMVLFLPYGANADEYAEVEVKEAGTEALTITDLPIEVFKTGHGVSLGMTVKEVESIFGRCVKSRQANSHDLFIEYEIANADSDPEVGRFGYPLYYAEYEFVRGRLTRFRFGFAYP